MITKRVGKVYGWDSLQRVLVEGVASGQAEKNGLSWRLDMVTKRGGGLCIVSERVIETVEEVHSLFVYLTWQVWPVFGQECLQELVVGTQ